MGIRKGSASPNLAVCFLERPGRVWALAEFVFPLLFGLTAAGCAGAVISAPASPSSTPPSITMQPESQTVTVGGAAVFAVTATGSAPLNYQWLENGIVIPGATSPTYTTPAAGASDNNSQFRAVVSNTVGTIISSTVTLTVNAPTLPAPVVEISSPAKGATISGTISITGTASDAVSVTVVQVSTDSGSYSNASGTNNWSFRLDTTALPNGFHTILAGATDIAGVTSTSSPLTVTVNNTTLASDCTLFGSPLGNDSNSGSGPTVPKTFTGAAAATAPGSVVCLHGGTYDLSSSFTPPNSGTPSSWIVYKKYGDGDVNFVWTGIADASPMFRLGSGSFPSGPAYLEFRGLNLNGSGNAGDAFYCEGAHHLRFIGNSMSNTGGSGIGTRDCDYLMADHNIINHNGYMPLSTSVPQWYGWTSGISFNSSQWFDSYNGFHNVISNNVVVGEYDSSSNHTDGNGIILDLSNGSYSASTANTPPALIINNVVYGNGGRCIHAFVVSNFWIVNNTCYKNNLDPTLGNAGSFSANNSRDGYFINNISVAWEGNNPTYIQDGTNTNIGYYADLSFGSYVNFTYSDPSQFIQADPLFVGPPSLSGGQYATALAPSLLSDGLTLLGSSPGRGKGIDPSTLPNLPAALVVDLKKYIYTDIGGKPRAQGSFDLGAYQF